MSNVTSDQIWRWLFTETWWSWRRPAGVPFEFTDLACHYFNLYEAAIWFVFSGLILHRWWNFRCSAIEIGYSMAFVTFAISDVVEAWMLTSWLLWWKLTILIALFWLRSFVIRRYYPNSRVY